MRDTYPLLLIEPDRRGVELFLDSGVNFRV